MTPGRAASGRPPQPGPCGQAAPAGGGWRCAGAGAGTARRGPLPCGRLRGRPVSRRSVAVDRLGRPGDARLLAVGGGRSGRGPARSVVHSRSLTVLTAHRGVRLAAIVPRVAPVRAWCSISFVPSFVGGSPGRLGGWLIRTRNRRWASPPRRFPYFAGTSLRKVRCWCFSTRRGCLRRKPSWCAPMCPRWWRRSGRWRCGEHRCSVSRGPMAWLSPRYGARTWGWPQGCWSGRGPPR